MARHALVQSADTGRPSRTVCHGFSFGSTHALGETRPSREQSHEKTITINCSASEAQVESLLCLQAQRTQAIIGTGHA